MKRLVLCLDGTWNRADQRDHGVPCPTNVVQMAFRVAKRDGTVAQVVYYDQGVGTGNLLDRLSGGAFGDGLEDNIKEAYRFLIANYEPGDEIFLFGFSRGAFTARSLAGMIRKCGILKRSSMMKEYPAAVSLHHSTDHPDKPVPMAFRQQHSVTGLDPLEIRFVGVWDTVGALGIPIGALRWVTRGRYEFHDTELSKSVRSAYHALAIDEHRAPFAPTLWMYVPKEGQTVEQMWFCGAHSDVGGGYAERGLSDIAMHWMVEKARGAGLAMDSEAMSAYPLEPDPRGTLHKSRRGAHLLAPRLYRPIGIAAVAKDAPSTGTAPSSDPTQSVHKSVLQRWDGDPVYRPAALATYFKMVGDVRA